MISNKFKYKLKVKAEDQFVLINAGYVVSLKDCAEGEFWLLTNSPKYLKMFVEGSQLEVIGDVVDNE